MSRSKPKTKRSSHGWYQKKAAESSPFTILQDFLVAADASAEVSDQEKADWVEAYVDLIDPLIFAGLWRGRGSPPHPPALMFKLTVFQILKKNLSPAKWAREVLSDSILQTLISNITPSRTALYNFHDRVGTIVQRIDQSLIKQAIQHKLLAPSVVALDGTSVRSYGSRHRIVNQKTLTRRRNELLDAISRDNAEETQTELPAWMGKSINGRLSQKESYDKANAILAQRIIENAGKRKASRRPIDQIYISLSDPESALSRDKENVYCPMYCGQLLTEAKSSLILGMSLSNHATDVGTIGSMIDQVKTSHGITINEIHADAAYASLLDVKACVERNVNLIAPVQENSLTKTKQSKTVEKQLSRDLFKYSPETHSYTCPAGHTMPYFDRDNRKRVNGIIVMERFRQSTATCQACPLAAQCLRGAKQRTVIRAIGQEIIDAQKAKMTDEVALASRIMRAQTTERTNADVKQRMGLRRFGVRTLQRAKNSLALTIVVLNLMTVRRLLIHAVKSTLATT